jgi:putative hemolysin
VGRACVDPAYRGGSVITLLLTGLTRWVVANRYDYVMGCASIDVTRGMAQAAALCRRLVHDHLAPEAWRVGGPYTPFRSARSDRLADTAHCASCRRSSTAYLRLARASAGEPAWDAEFHRPPTC